MKAQDTDIYWFDHEENLVLRGNPETSAIDTLSKIQSRLPIALDLAGGDLYWVDYPKSYQGPWTFRKEYPQNEHAMELFSLNTDGEVIMIRVDV